MTAARAEIERALMASRERLGALADRLARARARIDERASQRRSAAPAAIVPFGGSDGGPIDDVELTFRAVDSEAGGAGAGDHDKVP